MITKNFESDVVTWEEAIHDYDKSMKEGLPVKQSNPLGFLVTHNINYLPRVKKALDKLECKEAHLYCNFTTLAPTFGEHQDDCDVYFWQCQGETKWTIDGKDYILEPGDLIIVPEGVRHNVIPLTPRLGISMSKT
jgi:mannose-6-phosphate isomerase-like protein (cupin superfamily)